MLYVRSVIKLPRFVLAVWTGCCAVGLLTAAVARPIAPVYNTWGPVVTDLDLDDPGEPISVSGVVFVAGDDGGDVDPADHPLAGVLVSDGNQVVVSDNRGRYELTGVVPGLQRFVWVVIPSGYKIGDAFYHRIPVRSESFARDFALIPDARSSNPNHAFCHVTDAHGYAGPVWDGLTQDRFDFAVHTGDLVNNGGDIASVHAMKQALSRASIPVMTLPGNHDIFVNGSGELLTRSYFARRGSEDGAATVTGPDNGPELYEDFFGPSYYAFGYGGRYYVMLNSSAERDRQRIWIRNLLDALPQDREIIVCQHYPPEIDEAEFWSAVPGVRAILYGHTHADSVFTHDGILHVNTVGIAHSRDYSPLNLRKVRFDGDTITLTNLTRDFEDQHEFSPLHNVIPTHPEATIRIGDAWTDHKGDASRSGRADGTAGAPWTPVWVRALGGVAYFGSPVVSDSTLYVGVGDRRNRDRPRISALDPGSGQIIWSVDTGPNPLPALGPDGLYVTTRDARVLCLEPRSGREIWTRSLGHPMVYRLYTHAAWTDGKVLAGNGKHFAALDALTGNRLWRMPDVGAGMWATFSAPAAAGDAVVLTVPGRGIYRMDTASGDITWLAEQIAVNTINPSTPLLLNGAVYFNSRGLLSAVDFDTGVTLWQVRGVTGTSSPVTDGDGIILAMNAKVVKFDPANGDEVWVCDQLPPPPSAHEHQRYFGHRVMASAVVSAGQVHVATTDGMLLSLDAGTGELLAALYLARPFVATPAVSGNAMFLVSYDGTVYALSGLPVGQ